MPVVGASLLQLLLAVTFLIMPAIAYRYGASAQAAAEAEVARQGFPASILAKNKVKFTERGVRRRRRARLPGWVPLPGARAVRANHLRLSAGHRPARGAGRERLLPVARAMRMRSGDQRPGRARTEMVNLTGPRAG